MKRFLKILGFLLVVSLYSSLFWNTTLGFLKLNFFFQIIWSQAFVIGFALFYMTLFAFSFVIFFSNDLITNLKSLIFFFSLCTLLIVNLNLEFIGLNLIIIYLGAILVLVVFVVMLSNSNKINSKKWNILYLYIMFFLSLKHVFFLNIIFQNSFGKNKLTTNYLFDFNSNKKNELEQIAHYLYETNKSVLVLAAFVLLLALIISLKLTSDIIVVLKSTPQLAYDENEKH